MLLSESEFWSSKQPACTFSLVLCKVFEFYLSNISLVAILLLCLKMLSFFCFLSIQINSNFYQNNYVYYLICELMLLFNEKLLFVFIISLSISAHHCMSGCLSFFFLFFFPFPCFSRDDRYYDSYRGSDDRSK